MPKSPVAVYCGRQRVRRLVSYLDSCYTLLGRKYFTDVPAAVTQTVFTHVDSLMKDNITSICFTTDMESHVHVELSERIKEQERKRQMSIK